MPVSGIPDPEKHWICMRCGQWFEADEGTLVRQDRTSFSGLIADAIRGGGKLRFRCDACTERQTRTMLVVFGSLALLIMGT
jgi:hypothetical protein